MAARDRHALPPLFVAALLVCLALPLAAQRAVVTVSGPGLPPATDLVDVGRGQVSRLSNHITEAAVFTADGEVLLRRIRGDARWWARLMATGAEFPLPVGFGAQTVVVPPVLTAHPRQVAVFGPYLDANANTVPARVDGTGLSRFAPCGAATYYTSLDLSPDGARLFVLCPSLFNGPAQSVAILDSTSGAVLKRVALPGAVAVSVVVGPGGTSFAVVHLDVSDGIFTIERFDATSGALQQTVTFPYPVSGAVEVELIANPRRRHQPLLVRCRDIGDGLVLFDCTTHTLEFATLTIGAQVQASGRPPGVHFSADGGEVIISAGTYAARVRTETGAPLDLVAAPAGGFVLAAWGAEPQAPVLAAPVVSGRSVALTWTLSATSPAVTGYRVEAGAFPTAANLALLATGPAPTFATAGVPPGRYYVRVRAVNGNGVSAPSNEIVVDVP